MFKAGIVGGIAAALVIAAGCSSKPVAAGGPKNAAASQHPDWRRVAVDPSAEKGLAWLVSVQGPDGGFGQDGGSEGVVRKNVSLESGGNDVANTALVCMAFLRAGHTPGDGKYREALVRALEFILGQVEEAPADGILVTTRAGTQIQRKLGPHIDTFLAALVLAEVDGQMGDDRSQKRVRVALDKVVAKIQKNQQQDGSWNAGGGWAPVIGTSMASRSLYKAQEKGVQVEGAVLARVDDYSKQNWNKDEKKFNAAPAAAGVELYQAAQSFEQLNRSEEGRVAAKPMLDAAKERFKDAGFLNGFGSMGGEEFVSYLNISDSLVSERGDTWISWNSRIKEHLVKLQNQDGTWAGHHCITGRVACTASAVMTILSERTVAKL